MSLCPQIKKQTNKLKFMALTCNCIGLITVYGLISLITQMFCMRNAKIDFHIISEPRLLNLILLNLIVRWPSECSHYINNLWNATFGLWKIRIMNGWMVSFEWKTRKHHENRELVANLWFNFESFRHQLFFSVGKYFENVVKIILWKNLHNRIHN